MLGLPSCMFIASVMSDTSSGRCLTGLPRAPRLVDSPQIASATLLNPLPTYLRTYVWPYLAAYPAFLSIYLPKENYEKYIQSSEWTFVFLGTIITFHSLTWLSTHWSITLKALFTSTTVRTSPNCFKDICV